MAAAAVLPVPPLRRHPVRRRSPRADAAGTRATVALLETTDLHFNVRSFDYFKLAEDTSYGYERTAPR